VSDLFVIQFTAERSRHREKGLAEQFAMEIVGTPRYRSVGDPQPMAIARPQLIVGGRDPDGVDHQTQLTEVHVAEQSSAEQSVSEIEEDRVDRLPTGRHTGGAREGLSCYGLVPVRSAKCSPGLHHPGRFRVTIRPE
jgi:hypothetical protein